MYLKVQPYVSNVCKNTLNVPTFNSIRQLKSYIERNYKVCDSVMISLLKSIYDANLPNLFKLLISGGGMCGYWAFNYYRLFKALGYTVEFLGITLTNLNTIHYFIRVSTDDCQYDIDRDNCSRVSCMKSSLTLEWTRLSYSSCRRGSFISSINLHDDWLSEYELHSKVILPEGIKLELMHYTDAILSDVSSYFPKAYSELSNEETFKSNEIIRKEKL